MKGKSSGATGNPYASYNHNAKGKTPKKPKMPRDNHRTPPSKKPK